MSLTVKILGRSPVLPGGGTNISGVTSNDKEFVWGELSGSYVASGVTFSARDIGLTGSLDFIKLQPVTMIAAAGVGLIGTDTSIRAQYDEPDGVIIMQTVNNAGTVTESTATAYVVNFFACGESAKVANLT
jgi:hypothetical protein